jgi:hypothetical protein
MSIILIISSLLNVNAFSKDITLYCGFIRPGCEDVATDSVEIKFNNKNKIELIRKYHTSDIPITSAFVGELHKNVITARFDKHLTEKNSRQVQKNIPDGKITVYLNCANLKKLTNCKIKGMATEGNISKYPGWEDGNFRNAPTDLSCNTKEIQEFSPPECNNDN